MARLGICRTAPNEGGAPSKAVPNSLQWLMLVYMRIGRGVEGDAADGMPLSGCEPLSACIEASMAWRERYMRDSVTS